MTLPFVRPIEYFYQQNIYVVYHILVFVMYAPSKEFHGRSSKHRHHLCFVNIPPTAQKSSINIMKPASSANMQFLHHCWLWLHIITFNLCVFTNSSMVSNNETHNVSPLQPKRKCIKRMWERFRKFSLTTYQF